MSIIINYDRTLRLGTTQKIKVYDSSNNLVKTINTTDIGPRANTISIMSNINSINENGIIMFYDTSIKLGSSTIKVYDSSNNLVKTINTTDVNLPFSGSCIMSASTILITKPERIRAVEVDFNTNVNLPFNGNCIMSISTTLTSVVTI